MTITILVDNPKSWIIPYAKQLADDLAREHDAVLVHLHEEVRQGDVACFLSCEKIVKPDVLAKNKHNLVVHESALPLGKGWSPLTWQILEGKHDIPVTLFEAAEAVDSGDIYAETIIHFDGHELVDELRKAQGEATVALITEFVRNYPNISPRKQSGKETFYARRRPADSEIDPEKSLVEQFNQLRVADNEKYPAFFRHRGHRYILKIEKADL